MTDLLFDTPWWLPTAIAVVGVGLFVSGNKRRHAGMRAAGGAVALLAVLLVAASYFVDTDVEKAVKRTAALVDAVDRQDWQAFESLLDEQSSLGNYVGRAELTQGAQDAVEKFGVRKAGVLSQSVRQDDTLITVTVSAFSEQDMPPGPMRSTWEFDWQQRGDEWFLYRITPLSVGNQAIENPAAHLPPVRPVEK